MDNSGDSPQVPIPWEAVRVWLRDAESTQIKTGSTVHISPMQRLALSQLVPFTQESHMPPGDYVSKLYRTFFYCQFDSAAIMNPKMHLWLLSYFTAEFAQQRHLDMPRFTTESVTVPVTGIFTTLWKSTCLLPWSGRRFPESGKEDTTSFTSAKEAKQFAAMKAFAHVVKPPTQVSTVSITSSVGPPSSRGDDTANRHRPEQHGDEIATFDCKISKLAARLGIPQPEYSVEQDSDRPNCFTAIAEFGSGDASRGPKEPMLVTGVLGKAQAREAIGRKVLQWMEGEEKRGQDVLNSILAT